MSSTRSFFDDNNSFKFTPLQPKHVHSLTKTHKLEATLNCKSLNSEFSLRGLFKLHDNILAYYEEAFPTTPICVLDLSFSRLTEIGKNPKNNRHKFQISKNGASFELNFVKKEEGERWRRELRSTCVLNDFYAEYNLVMLLGKGAFASVYLVQHKITFEYRAVKGFAKKYLYKPDSKEGLIGEINMMKNLNHRNLTKLYEVHESENSIYLIMEYITSQTLRNVIKRKHSYGFQADLQDIQIMKSILSGLSYLSERNIMHRDLKPDNIVVDSEFNVKIIDFGLAAFYDNMKFLHDRCGTAGYIAPEIFGFRRENPATAYNDRCDIFSAGCIFFQMLLGFRMFECENAEQTLRVNSLYCKADASEHTKNYILAEIDDDESQINKQGLDLLLRMLEPDQKKRISAAEALKHPYFNYFSDESIKTLNSQDELQIFDEKPKINNILLHLDTPRTGTKCLLSVNGERSPVSMSRKDESIQKVWKVSPYSSQEYSPSSPDKSTGSNFTAYVASTGRELSLEKPNGKAGARQRTSIFGLLKKEPAKREPEEHSEDIGDIGDENGEEAYVINGALNYHNMQFVTRRASQALVTDGKQ